jgi:hypothetical protein
MTTLTVGRYLRLVEDVYTKRGGLDGQRAPLKTKTGITIRSRLVSDLQNGAVIPPVVLGVFAEDKQIAELAEIHDSDAFSAWFSALDAEAISIIDGMQRTTALKEAVAANGAIADATIRVEFWISKYLNSLIYRMLVLNTGQVPWELGRQLETVYSQFLKKISSEIDGEADIFERDEKRRRVSPGQYQGSSIIELLLIFSSRKSEIDIKDRVAEDFARLDAIDTTAHAEFVEFFIQTLRLMVRLDRAFSRLPRQENADTASRLQAGKDIFAAFPAMAGFTAAISVFLFDEPGFKIEWLEAPDKMAQVQHAIETVAARIDKLDAEGVRQFMQMETLAERLSGRRGGIGRFERETFRRAFTTMIKNAGRLESMEPCWLAS